MASRGTCVELHDARVEAVEHEAGTCVVTFSHLCVFERIAEDEYEVWSYRAKLRILQASEVVLPGPLLEDDRVYDASVRLSDGTDISQDTENFGLGVRCEDCRVRLSFSSGAILTVAGSEMTLEEIQRVKFIERWAGPLLTPQGGGPARPQ